MPRPASSQTDRTNDPASQPQRPSQRERQRAETRERIYQAALAEFSRVGASAAEIPRIASAAGVVRGTFYYHFPSKEHVLRELAERVQRRVADAMSPLRERPAGLSATLTLLLDTVREVADGLAGHHLLQDMSAMLVRAPFPDEQDTTIPPLAETLLEILGESLRRGEVRGGVELEPLVGMILNSLFGLIAAPNHPDRDRDAEFALLKDVFLRGMRATP